MSNVGLRCRTVITLVLVFSVIWVVGLILSACATAPHNTVSASITLSPTKAVVNEGGTQQFTATVINCDSNCGVYWSVLSGNGTITPTGLFTAPNNQETDTVQAQAEADLTKTASASIIVPPVSIIVSPVSVTLQPGGTQQFNATVSGTMNKAVTWSEVGNGTVSTSGFYTAPSTNETDAVIATANAAPNPTANATVTIEQESSTQCGNTLNWTNSACQVIGSGALNTAWVNGAQTSNAWTVISRHGEYAQDENECNIPSALTQASSSITVTTTNSSYTCGSFNSSGQSCPATGCANSSSPASWPYSTGDMQWNTFNFEYGTVVASIKAPNSNTGTWPAIWLLVSTCQDANKWAGDTGFDSCPNVGTTGYSEIDMAEWSPTGGWPQQWVANDSNDSGGNLCTTSQSPTNDGNYHVYSLHWASGTITSTIDGNNTNCSYSGSLVPSRSMFLIYQIQTAASGAPCCGPPNNSNLPATMTMQYVKVCDNNITQAQCNSATGPNDPTYGSHVIFYDDFGSSAQRKKPGERAQGH